jgi:hypothetical protein
MVTCGDHADQNREVLLVEQARASRRRVVDYVAKGGDCRKLLKIIEKMVGNFCSMYQRRNGPRQQAMRTAKLKLQFLEIVLIVNWMNRFIK